MTTLALNALRATTMRFLIPQSGPWIADVDFELPPVPVVPSGRCTLKVDLQVLIGTIDPSASGRHGELARARVIAGGGGWHKPVKPLPFHSDAGVLSTQVLAATAAEVGEVLVDASPTILGVDYLRSAGPASRVLAGLSWYVDFQGITLVAPRVPIPLSPLATVLSWNAKEQRAEIACDTLIVPGTTIVNPEIGAVTVRDVEQTFSSKGARATVWCASESVAGAITGGSSSPKSRLTALLGALAREATGATFLKEYPYRVVSTNPADGRLTVQAKTRSLGVPDALLLTVMPGLPGTTVIPKPGSEVMVGFANGDPALPVVVAFDKSQALEITIDTLSLKVGAGALNVIAAPVGPSALLWFSQVQTAVNALSPGSVTAPPPIVATKLRTD